jgi:hypothetical protein
VRAILVGDATVRAETLTALPEHLEVIRAPIAGPISPNRGIVNLGAAESARGWTTVDVLFEIAPADAPVPAAALAVTLDGQRLDRPLERDGDGRFVIRDVPARGGVLRVGLVDPALGGAIALDDAATIVLPDRPPIAVWLAPGLPDALRAVLRLDPAVRFEDSRDAADVVFGEDGEATFRLAPADGGAAFTVTVGPDDAAPEDLGEVLIDELALRQIDAATLAEQASREIRLTIEAGDRRRIAVWRELLEEPYDFCAGHAFPVFVARSVRWLAGRPALLPWARADEPLPAAAGLVWRPAREGGHVLADGRPVEVALLERDPGAGASTDGDPVEPGERRGPDLFGLLGLLAAALLATEWALYQRGRVP